MKNVAISQVIRYEEQLKLKIQSIDNHILQGGRSESDRKQLNEYIQEEEILLKYLQVQSSKMANEVRALYAKNLTRFKKKIKQHKEYFSAYFRVQPKQQDAFNVRGALEIEKQNNELFGQKIAMYENQNLQANVGFQLQHQGQVIQQGIQMNHQIRRQANASSDAIKLIHASILKRKFMFYSIFVLFAIAITFIILRKIFA